MPIVSDASPLNYLVLIELVDILPMLHERVVVPMAVLENCELPPPQVLCAVGLKTLRTGLKSVTRSPRRMSVLIMSDAVKERPSS